MKNTGSGTNNHYNLTQFQKRPQKPAGVTGAVAPAGQTAQVTPQPLGWDSTKPGSPAHQLFNSAVIFLIVIALIRYFTSSPQQLVEKGRGTGRR